MKDATNHDGETEIRDDVTANCHTAGYTGDTYCLGCNTKIAEGETTEKDATNHDGETEIRDAVAPNCHTAGYTGDTYCLGCNTKIETGTSTEKDASVHDGGTKKVYYSEGETGYEYYVVCLGCGEKTGETGVTPYDDETFDPGEVEWDPGEILVPGS